MIRIRVGSERGRTAGGSGVGNGTRDSIRDNSGMDNHDEDDVEDSDDDNDDDDEEERAGKESARNNKSGSGRCNHHYQLRILRGPRVEFVEHGVKRGGGNIQDV